MNLSRILVVDDEPLNVESLVEALEGAGYAIETANDGVEAWDKLSTDPSRFDVALLDRMMPRMGGMELLYKMQQVPALAIVPVIFQTARAGKEDIIEGLKAGAHYYLAKPYDDETLLAVVATAIKDHRRRLSVARQAAVTAHTMLMLENGTFRFRTLKEARDLAALLANASNPPGCLAVGLLELLANAVEHGNLGIGYAEKTRLIACTEWPAEVERRLALPHNADKQVTVEFTRTSTALQFRIADEGAGFEWQRYKTLSAERAFDSHGRGIALAGMLSFTRLEYLGKGNEVLAILELKGSEPAAAE